MPTRTLIDVNRLPFVMVARSRFGEKQKPRHFILAAVVIDTPKRGITDTDPLSVNQKMRHVTLTGVATSFSSNLFANGCIDLIEYPLSLIFIGVFEDLLHAAL
jgi:hypothetical protein